MPVRQGITHGLSIARPMSFKSLLRSQSSSCNCAPSSMSTISVACRVCLSTDFIHSCSHCLLASDGPTGITTLICIYPPEYSHEQSRYYYTLKFQSMYSHPIGIVCIHTVCLYL